MRLGVGGHNADIKSLVTEFQCLCHDMWVCITFLVFIVYDISGLGHDFSDKHFFRVICILNFVTNAECPSAGSVRVRLLDFVDHSSTNEQLAAADHVLQALKKLPLVLNLDDVFEVDQRGRVENPSLVPEGHPLRGH